MKKLALVAVLLFAPAIALAAKVQIDWTNPTTYVNGAPISVLGHETVYVGTCSSSAIYLTPISQQVVNGTVPGAKMFAWIYPTGNGPFCFVVTATSTLGAESKPSNTVEWTPPPTPGQPMQLGAILHVILSPPHRKKVS